MGDPNQFVFKLKELTEVMIRHQGLRDGLWGIFIEFGISATNIPSGDELIPAAVVPIMKVGIQRFDAPNATTIDAATISPIVQPPAGDVAGHRKSSKKGRQKTSSGKASTP